MSLKNPDVALQKQTCRPPVLSLRVVIIARRLGHRLMQGLLHGGEGEDFWLRHTGPAATIWHDFILASLAKIAHNLYISQSIYIF